MKMNRITAARPGKPFYIVLGVSPDATEDEIRRQWRSVAAAHHPDVRGGELSDLYQKCKRAADVLTSPALRKFYDQTEIDPMDDARAKERDAVDAIRSVVRGILDEFEPGQNLLARVREALKAGITTREIELRRIDRNIQGEELKLAEIEKRWSGTSPARGVVVDILADQIESMKASRKVFVSAIECGRLALVMMEADDYEIPAPLFTGASAALHFRAHLSDIRYPL